MKTIRIKLYKFDELSKEAKEAALENWIYETEYFGAEEAIESLKKLAEHFCSELINYEIDWGNSSYSWAKFDTTDYDPEASSEFATYEEWLKNKVEQLGEYNPKTLRGLGDCVLTGVCYDEDAIDGLRKLYFDGELDLNNLLQAGFITWLKNCQSDFKSQHTLEYFKDFANANDYYFTKDGNLN